MFPISDTEIHAVLARDRYINFTGWALKKDGYIYGHDYLTGAGAEEIPHGFLKEMILQLNSVSEDGKLDARVILTSQEKTGIRELFLRFQLFTDGVKVKTISLFQNGTQTPENESECLEYKYNGDYFPIDGLLIQLDCKTTNVKKILVKCIPK
uniref:Uncharacterized protein n=1 Tax=Panagrolaimus superbus TaxID=310955 RepID=A0A914YPL3_9BILA